LSARTNKAKDRKFQRKFTDSDELCRYVKEHFGDTHVLGFSGGKDSVACWLQLRRHGIKVIAAHMYYTPDMRLTDEVLGYYEDFFGQRIHRYPHTEFLRRLDHVMYAAPRQVRIFDQNKRRRDLSISDYALDLKKRYGVPGALLGDGTRSTDSLRRLITMRRFGTLYPAKGYFFCVYDWNDARVEQEIRAAGVKLSPEYRLMGRGWESDAEQLEPLGREYPDDLEKVLHWHPLLRAELWRRRFARSPAQDADPETSHRQGTARARKAAQPGRGGPGEPGRGDGDGAGEGEDGDAEAAG
jgi:hypothetical protein